MSVIVSDLYSVILKAGVSAAISAGNTGPKMEITGFRIGNVSAREGAVARKEDTDVDGFVYSGDATEIYYAELPEEDACLFRIVLDENIGDFDVGQICLMIGDVAFSKSVLYARQAKWKNALPGRLGNNFSFDIVLALSDAQACINLTLLKSLYAVLPEVADETRLPSATSSIYNTYIVRNHTSIGVACVAVRRNGVWNFSPLRSTVGQGEAVLAAPPEKFDDSVRINMAVYYDKDAAKYMPADATNSAKFPVGVRTSAYEITQVGYVKRHVADDVWPETVTAGEFYYVQTDTPGIPGSAPTYYSYGRASSNDLIYVDMANRFGASSLAQFSDGVTGERPMIMDHQHPIATTEQSGYMSAADFKRLYNPSTFILEGGGIDIVPMDNDEKVQVSISGEVGFPIAPDSFDMNLKSGAPVCMRVVNDVRTWIAADPTNGLRPEGVLSDDRQRIITSGRMTINSAISAWPSPLLVGGVYFAGEGLNAGKVLDNGNWIIGNATGVNEMIIALEPIASVEEHVQAISQPQASTHVKNASPKGVLEMLEGGYLSKGDVAGSRGIVVVRKTENATQPNDVDVRSTLGDGSRIKLESTGITSVALNSIAIAPSSIGALTQYAEIVPVAFSASGGVAPYTYEINAGQLPTGLSMAESGELSGTPVKAGRYSFSVKATDANAKIGVKVYTGNVAVTVVNIGVSPATLGVILQKTAIAPIQLSSVGGYSPYVYSIDSGALPAGLVMDATGRITGTALNAEVYSVTIKVVDLYNNSQKVTYTGEVEPAGVDLTLVSAPFKPLWTNWFRNNPNQTLDMNGFLVTGVYPTWPGASGLDIVANSTHFNYWGDLAPGGSLTPNNFHDVPVYAVVEWKRNGFHQNVRQNWWAWNDTGSQDAIHIYMAGYLPQNTFTRIDIPGIGRLYSADATVKHSRRANFFYQKWPGAIYKGNSFSTLFGLHQSVPATMWAWPKPEGTALTSGNINIL